MTSRIDKFGYDDVGAVRRTVELGEWRRSRGGVTFSNAIRRWIADVKTMDAGYIVEKAWEIHLVQLIEAVLLHYIPVGPNSVPKPFAKCEWDDEMFRLFLGDLEGEDYNKVFAMDKDTSWFLRDFMRRFAQENMDLFVERPAKTVKRKAKELADKKENSDEG